MVRVLSVVSLALVSAEEAHPIHKDLVDRINQRGSWTATEPEQNRFASYSLDEIRGLMGLRGYVPVNGTSRLAVGDIPESFDGRSEFSSCQKGIRDQAGCGSCWAFGAAETLTTNLCVLGQGNPVLSPQDLVSCDSSDHGCEGGTLPGAWDFIDKNGLVSDDCMPYASGDGSEPTCSSGCTGSGSPKKYKCPVAPTFINSDSEIQAAVMTVGAVEVGFTVYEDFMNYKSGVYSYQEGQALGGHAVKIVGWGKEISTFYWIVQNSWGASWGESGFFRIVNWHADKQSAIAIGGGQACVQGPTPSPPAPPPAPVTCDDIAGYCSDYVGQCGQKDKSYLIPVCKKTCGCCGVLPPSYCSDDEMLV